MPIKNYTTKISADKTISEINAMNELKPCPFCGGEVERDNPMPGYCSGYGFYCPKCDSYFTTGDDEEEAAKKFNTRYERTCHIVEDKEGRSSCSECGASYLCMSSAVWCPDWKH